MKKYLTLALFSLFFKTASSITIEQLNPVTQLVDGEEYAIRNANQTLTKRNFYWGSWNNSLQTQSTGNVDDITFEARQHEIEGHTYWTLRVTSATNWGFYLGRYGANNVAAIREQAFWTISYDERADYSGFVLLLKGDEPGGGHEMMMNQGGDWVVSFIGSSTDKTANSSHWEFFHIPHESVDFGDYPIQNVVFSNVSLSDKFWSPRMEQNQSVTIPVALQQCYDTRRILNFQKAAAILRGDNIGYFDTEFTFDDTDIYKILEGMAYSVQVRPNPTLDAKMDELIELIGSAQEPDGYLYTPRTAGNPAGLHWQVGQNRWELDPVQSHELYCSGHLFEAAVAHYLSTGKTTLLDIAKKNADLLVKEFLIGGLTYEPGHQIVEMGLVKMYRVTGNEDYLKLAKYFLDLRGTLGSARNINTQTHKPVVLQDEAVGHAVRAAYMYSGMADVAAIMGDADYLNAIDKIWDNVVSKKYYLNGGIGARHNGEEFGANYELPNESAYCETCAAIGNVYWNWRMFLLHGDAKYYDVIERTLYNGVISGISLSGNRFFYPNPLESHGGYGRSEWFGCACCPSNLCRFLASIPGYMYASTHDKVYLNLYAKGTASIPMKDNGNMVIDQVTDYPWDGNIKLTITKLSSTNNNISLMLRLPGWAKNNPVPSDLYSYWDNSTEQIVLFVNGVETAYTMQNGYMMLNREWAEGDVVEFMLPMHVHHVVANESIAEDQGKVALERGPIVYCLEGIDNDEQVFSSIIGDDAPVEAKMDNTLFSATNTQLMTLSVQGQIKVLDAEGNITSEDHTFTAIPYYAWANRGNGTMAIWLPRTEDKAVVSDFNRIVDAVDTGESSSEQSHQGKYTSGSNTGTYSNETWRDTPGGGFVQYLLKNVDNDKDNVALSMRFTTNDVGREAIVTIDGEPLVKIVVPSATYHASSSGMYDVEIPIPKEMLVDESGTLKTDLTFRITSTLSNISIPGIFYLRLLSPSFVHEYNYVATEWATADSNRLKQLNIVYDEDNNTITATPNSGNYNLALTLNIPTKNDYVVIGKKYLVVKGRDISPNTADHVLWWLNGINKGSSMPASEVFTNDNSDVIVAWNITDCPLNANCLGDWWNINTGMTCFGLTSTSDTSTISYIGFDESLEPYKLPTAIHNPINTKTNILNDDNTKIYTLPGYRIGEYSTNKGMYIINGKKILVL